MARTITWVVGPMMAAVLLGLPLSAGAQTPAPGASAVPPAQEGSTVPQPDRTTASYGAWVLNCGQSAENGRRCEVTQTLVNPQGQPLVQFVARRGAASGSVSLAVQVGVNVAVSEAARLTPEGQSGLALPFARCLPRGCFAEATLPEATLSGLAKLSETARLEYRSADGGAVSFPVSLRGLSAALEAMHSTEQS